MSGRVRLGTFDAESWWRPADLAALPAVPGGGGAAVAGMDELLAGFCRPGDLLVTRGPMDPALVDGLAEAGVHFGRVDAGTPSGGPVERRLPDPVVAQMGEAEGLVPYAVLPDTVALAERMGWDDLPDLDAVIAVNSKTWSNEVVRRLGLPGAGRVVRTVDDLVAAVSEVDGAAVVKDPYGVSGRAILEVGTPGVLAAVVRVLRKQVEAGKRVELLVQPKFAKRHDFSGHLVVDRGGNWEWLGVQAMTNRGFRHLESGPVPPGLVDEDGYRRALTGVVEAVAETGYFGPIGVDSMLLDDGRVVPVLEVNARHSLGLLTRTLDLRVAHHGLRCHLTQLDLVVGPDRGVADLVRALGAASYRGGEDAGVTVLSGSALTSPGGRVYVAVFCRQGELPLWRDRLRAAVAAAGMSTRGVPDAA
ncbi:hypothetical protein ACFFQW_01145 [Umezawaea endophytica]|uniref:ATP-grasp domain-containing protein n=1 Tax=Umezawaea endophytica TaxID=1654476 RepID=A0A9X2VIT6_9PSEU|nr:hypothetical protein [Umezawaea endophytica]MCS7476857.1 hypothetical protein [Umezawaea endophytica]